jgi:hypothetical protein
VYVSSFAYDHYVFTMLVGRRKPLKFAGQVVAVCESDEIRSGALNALDLRSVHGEVIGGVICFDV